MSRELGVCCQEGRVSYFYGTLPVFKHEAKDVKSFRMFTSQLYVEGKVKQADVVRVFGVSSASVKRAVKLYEQAGPSGFWKQRKPRGAAVLTAPVLKEAQRQLDEDLTVQEVSSRLNIKYNTLQKAVQAGKLHVAKKKTCPPLQRQRL